MKEIIKDHKKEKEELAQNFVNYLVDQLDVNLGFDSGIFDLEIDFFFSKMMS